MELNEIQIIIFITSILFFTIVGMILFYLYIFQKKKTDFLMRQREQERKFEEVLIRSQIEIKENTLKNIAWELHDNIGQLLSLAKMQLNIIGIQECEHKQEINEIGNIVGKTLQEIRSFSKILNEDVIHSIGLHKAIQIEIDRFNRMNFLKADLEVLGQEKEIPTNDEIILFRIIQEVFSNTIKHSKARHLKVKLDYSGEILTIYIKDDGVGFDFTTVEKGSGLLNMKGRAKLIHTNLLIDSNENGTTIIMEYPFKKKKLI
jgi:signal transduction histidine kinase